MKQLKGHTVMTKIAMYLCFAIGIPCTTLAILLGLGLLMQVEEQSNIIGIFVFVLVVGVFGISGGRSQKSNLKKFKNYAQILSEDPTGSIENLASALDITEEIAIKNLNMMINNRLFINAYINKEENRIVFSESSSDFVKNNIVSSENNYNTPDELIVTNCKSCGGTNKIQRGKSIACEYCGSPLK